MTVFKLHDTIKTKASFSVSSVWTGTMSFHFLKILVALVDVVYVASLTSLEAYFSPSSHKHKETACESNLVS